MIEQGLVMLVQAGLGTPPMAPGGWPTQLPPNQISAASPMAWTYRRLGNENSYVLEGQDGFTTWHIEIACYGYTPRDSKALARAIDGIFAPATVNGLRGNFRGPLPDPDATFVYGVFSNGATTEDYSDANRSYVLMAEYQIQFAQF